MENSSDLTHYFSKRAQFNEMIKNIFEKKNIFDLQGGPAMLTNVHRPNQPSFIEMSTFTCKSTQSPFMEKRSEWIYHVFYHGCASASSAECITDYSSSRQFWLLKGLSHLFRCLQNKICKRDSFAFSNGPNRSENFALNRL